MIEALPGTLIRLEVPEGANGTRLDRFLSTEIAGPSRAALRRWILDGRVLLGGSKATKAGATLRAGLELTVLVPDLPTAAEGAPDVPFTILHEDEAIVVVDKPAGVAVHRGHGRDRGTLVDGLLGRGIALAPRGGPVRPGIVHRLDAGTSGVLVVAKTDRAYDALARAFAERRVRKLYRALVWGRVDPPEGAIERAIGRSRSDPTRMAVHHTRGRSREARTVYRTREALSGFTLLDVLPETGRTHQIRVHLESIRHPIVGDDRYGGRRWRGVLEPTQRRALRDLGRLALHAARLEFEHPTTGASVRFVAPWPADLDAILDVLRAGA